MNPLESPFVTIGTLTVSHGQAFVGAVALLGLLVAIGLWALLRQQTVQQRSSNEEAERARQLDAQLNELNRQHAEMTGRMQTMAEVFGSRQADLARGLREQLEGFGHRVGQNLTNQAQATHENLTKLNERLAVIDDAQKNLTELSREVVSLQDILANKQQRGAFGQGRMEAIVMDGLPRDAYTFQATLSNDKRPDCLIKVPNGAPGLVVDAKFPLEAFNAYREAETEPERKGASQRMRTDVTKHITDIRDRYLIPGETQDIALMFVPSESIYADLQEHFEELVQKAYKARVVIVGPSLLMLAIQVVQAILRDQRMREQAHVIQSEVAYLLADVARLRDRVANLQRHFGHAGTDIEKIVTSADKIGKRGARIESLEFEDDPENLPAAMQRSLAAGE